jgi:hypothetical protein
LAANGLGPSIDQVHEHHESHVDFSSVAGSMKKPGPGSTRACLHRHDERRSPESTGRGAIFRAARNSRPA